MKRVLAVLGLLVFLAGCGGGMQGSAFVGTSADSNQVGSDFELPPSPPADEPAGPDSDLPPGPPGD